MFLLTNDFWKIKKTKSKGLGVFAKKKIKAGTIIGDYLGKVINIAEYDLDRDKNGLFLMYYSDQAGIYPDTKKPGLHLVNHACRPNCWMYIYHGHILFFARQEIEPDEELTIAYLLSPKDDMCNPCTHVCMCGSDNCTGTMHLSPDKYKKWQAFQNLEKKKTRTVKVKFGKNLPKLNHYPKTIRNNPIYALIST